MSDVRYWHKADMPSCTAHVRFRGKADMLSPASAHWVCSGGEESGSQISALGNDCTRGTL